MLFQTIDFLVFLLVVLTAYWCLPRRGQNVLLLVSSYFFYAYVHPWFAWLLAASSVVDYLAALGIANRPEHKRSFMALSLVSNLGMLAVFKYFNFFVENLSALLVSLGASSGLDIGLRLMLPVGISFYTFQTLSYTIDVYRGELEARRGFLDYAVFVSFFPQLVAGPIERASHLLPEFEAKRRIDLRAVNDGVLLIVWGLFKKLVIADNVARIADRVFLLENVSFPVLWAGVLAFGVQIYADFSAYSDIARGVSRLFGIELMENFRHPYMARGPSDFWHRWHISLSTWFRDYVYIPLGGSREGGQVRQSVNIMVTFLLSGFWHGASWNFVIWGGYWGLLLVLARMLSRTFPRLEQLTALVPLRIVVTFVLAHIGWLMFREHELGPLLAKLTLHPLDATDLELRVGAYLAFSVLLTASPLAIHAFHDEWVKKRVAGLPELDLLRPVLIAVLLAGVLVLRSTTTVDFIYFQF